MPERSQILNAMFFAVVASVTLASFVNAVSRGWPGLEKLPGVYIGDWVKTLGVPFPRIIEPLVVYSFVGTSIVLLGILWKFIGAELEGGILDFVFVIIIAGAPALIEHLFALFVWRIVGENIWNKIDLHYIVSYSAILILLYSLKKRSSLINTEKLKKGSVYGKWPKIKRKMSRIGEILPRIGNIEYGENLRAFFLIFFSLSATNISLRFFSAQEINPAVYLQHLLHSTMREGSIMISIVANLSSLIAFASSVAVALWFASWIKENCSEKFWIVIFKDVPITLLISFSPYNAFWIGTCLLSGLDVHFLALLGTIVPTFTWWNSNYIFIFLQAIFAFLILNCRSPRTSLVAFARFCFLLISHSLLFVASSRLRVHSIYFYALFNFGILLAYLLILVIVRLRYVIEETMDSDN